MAKMVDWNLRDEDIADLRLVLDEKNAPEVSERERVAFREMLSYLLRSHVMTSLSRKQRAWVKEVVERVKPLAGYPRGREVHTPAVLQNLPLKPPGRR